MPRLGKEPVALLLCRDSASHYTTAQPNVEAISFTLHNHQDVEYAQHQPRTSPSPEEDVLPDRVHDGALLHGHHQVHQDQNLMPQEKFLTQLV